MNRKMTEQIIASLRESWVCLTDIERELNYRDIAGNNRWDDDLYDYSTEELESIEEHWCEI